MADPESKAAPVEEENSNTNEKSVASENDGNEVENESENEADRGEEEEEEEETEEQMQAAIAKMVEELQAQKGKPKVVRKKFQRKKKQVLKAEILEDPEIVRFFQGREKYPEGYSFTEEGNLKIQGVKDVPNKTIVLKNKFVDFQTEADYADLYAKRLEALKEIETQFDAALQALRIVQEEYNLGSKSADEVVRANQAVLDLSKARSRIAYPEIWTDLVKKATVKDVLMHTEPYEKRKMKYPIFLLKHYELNRKEAWGKYEERSTAAEPLEGGAIRIRFITDLQDESTAHFHPFFQRNFTFNETEYCCMIQAYEGERFKELGKEDLRKQVLGTRSGRTIHSIAIKDKTLPNQPQQLWEDILFQFFYQHPDLRKELDSTGTDKFHVMDKEVPANYGAALEGARLRLRELGDKDLDHQETKEKVITEEQQKKAKVGAIVNNFRKKF